MSPLGKLFLAIVFAAQVALMVGTILFFAVIIWALVTS